jgi:hypothetical protein
MKCDSQASFLAYILTSPCLGHEPKARVVTHNMFMQYLLVDLKQVVERQQIILVELQSGLVHPIQVMKF